MRRREFIIEVAVAAKQKRARIALIQRRTIVLGLATLNLWCSAASAQISNLPEDIQKRLSEINPLYQSNISKRREPEPHGRARSIGIRHACAWCRVRRG